jgi:hypothetical protein
VRSWQEPGIFSARLRSTFSRHRSIIPRDRWEYGNKYSRKHQRKQPVQLLTSDHRSPNESKRQKNIKCTSSRIILLQPWSHFFQECWIDHQTSAPDWIVSLLNFPHRQYLVVQRRRAMCVAFNRRRCTTSSSHPSRPQKGT